MRVKRVKRVNVWFQNIDLVVGSITISLVFDVLRLYGIRKQTTNSRGN